MDRRTARIGLLASLAILSLVAGPARMGAADSGVEQRIADFWNRINALSPGDYVSSADLGQWALNVIDRDATSRMTVADFRAATAGMQASMDRAGRAPSGATPTPVAAPPATPTAPLRPPSTPSPSPISGATVYSPTSFSGRETVTVTWTNPAPAAGSYITFVDANGAYRWIWLIDAVTVGTLTLKPADLVPGVYQLRMYSASGAVLAFGPFVTIR